MRCAVCLRGVSITRDHGSETYRVRCSASRAGYVHNPCTGFGSPRLTLVEDLFRRITEGWQLDHYEHDHGGLTDAQELTGRLDLMLGQQRDAEVSQKRLTSRWARGDLPDSVFEATAAELAAEIKSRKTQIEELRLAVDAAPPTPEAAAKRLTYIAEAIDGLPVPEARAAISEVLMELHIHPASKGKARSAPWDGGLEPVWNEAPPAHD